MIEMSQKLDQLLEGQAKILAVFTRPDQTMDTTVESLANMSTKTDYLGDKEKDLADD